jgi:PPM family protein phosphatase
LARCYGMNLILNAATVTDVGLVRTNNEDCAHAGRRVFAVADGVGGLPAGELASAIVVRALAELEGETAPPDDPLALLRRSVESANRQIREAAAANPAHEGMATTVTALLLAGEQIALVHVGDSRCYRLREGELEQLTRDDTLVQELVEHGLLTAAQARAHPRRSLVTQAVQGDNDLSPTLLLLNPRPADRFLLCSDGLSDAVTDQGIASVLRTVTDPQECAERLVRLALTAGAADNVTVLVADVRRRAGTADIRR